MKIITVKLPEQFLEAIDELVNTGRYSSRSEVIRAAIGDFIRKELWVSAEEWMMKAGIFEIWNETPDLIVFPFFVSLLERYLFFRFS